MPFASMRSPNFKITKSTKSTLVLEDVGPWDTHMTITNGVEDVLHELSSTLDRRRLFYWDSDGNFTQIIYQMVDGKAKLLRLNPLVSPSQVEDIDSEGQSTEVPDSDKLWF